MKIFKLVWKFGKEEYVKGNDIADACNKAGIGNGAIRALDYWEEVKEFPNELKQFEIVSDGEEPSEIHNPYFIEQLKMNGFIKGSVTEIKFANMLFKYEFMETSPTAFQFKEI